MYISLPAQSNAYVSLGNHLGSYAHCIAYTVHTYTRPQKCSDIDMYTVCYCLMRAVCLSFIYIFIIRNDGVSGVFIDKGIPREIPY